MATRSRIAIEKEDGSVQSIYCHFDGYPEYNGRILVEHYNTREKVEALVSLGALSSLNERIAADAGEEHSFRNPAKGVTIAYARDLDEDLSIQEHISAESYFCGDIEEYGYLFTKQNEWVMMDGYRGRKGGPYTVAGILK